MNLKKMDFLRGKRISQSNRLIKLTLIILVAISVGFITSAGSASLESLETSSQEAVTTEATLNLNSDPNTQPTEIPSVQRIGEITSSPSERRLEENPSPVSTSNSPDDQTTGVDITTVTPPPSSSGPEKALDQAILGGMLGGPVILEDVSSTTTPATTEIEPSSTSPSTEASASTRASTDTSVPVEATSETPAETPSTTIRPDPETSPQTTTTTTPQPTTTSVYPSSSNPVQPTDNQSVTSDAAISEGRSETPSPPDSQNNMMVSSVAPDDSSPSASTTEAPSTTTTSSTTTTTEQPSSTTTSTQPESTTQQATTSSTLGSTEDKSAVEIFDLSTIRPLEGNTESPRGLSDKLTANQSEILNQQQTSRLKNGTSQALTNSASTSFVSKRLLTVGVALVSVALMIL